LVDCCKTVARPLVEANNKPTTSQQQTNNKPTTSQQQ